MTVKTPEPCWPVIVFSSGNSPVAYDKETWNTDADLCDAPGWVDTDRIVDSSGKEFRIVSRIIKKTYFLWIIPLITGTNDLVSTGRTMAPKDFVDRLATGLRDSKSSVLSAEDYHAHVKGIPDDAVIRDSISFILSNHMKCAGASSKRPNQPGVDGRKDTADAWRA